LSADWSSTCVGGGVSDTYQTKLTVNGRNPGSNTLAVYRTAGTECTELAATYRNQNFWLPAGYNWMTRKWISGEDQGDSFKQCVCVLASPSKSVSCQFINASFSDVYRVVVSGVSQNSDRVIDLCEDCDLINGSHQLNFVGETGFGFQSTLTWEKHFAVSSDCERISRMRLTVSCGGLFSGRVALILDRNVAPFTTDASFWSDGDEWVIDDMSTPGSAIDLQIQSVEDIDNRACNYPDSVTVRVPDFE